MHPKIKPAWKWITTTDPVKIIVVVVVLVLSVLSWYFSFRYATNSITTLSEQITKETVEKVGLYINDFLNQPVASIEMSASLLSSRILDPYENSSAHPMLQHCWDTINYHKNLRSYTISLPIPGYIGYILLGDQVVQIADWYPLTEPPLMYYILTVDANGTADYTNQDTWIVANPDIDINKDPQMQRCAAYPQESFWNDPYIFPPSPDQVWISYVKPVIDSATGVFSAAVSCDFTVTSLGDYLTKIKPTENTKSMITDAKFNVIANSVGEFPFIVDPGNENVTFSATPVPASQIKDSTLRSAASRLPGIFDRMTRTGETMVQTSFNIRGSKQLLLVKRIQNINIDWLAVLIVPNSDFFHKIDVARQTTIWISVTGIVLSALKILIDNRLFIAKVLHLPQSKKTLLTNSASTTSVSVLEMEQ